MRFERVFQFSIYLTLAVATLGLCSSEHYFIPEINWFLGPTLVLLAVAYLVEGRWSLSALASNVIGIVIAAGAGLWVARGLAQPSSQLIEHAPYPAAFLPFGGPVLMLVMLAKLFRPKQINDYWGLHVIGLMEASLGCILAGDPEFSLWLLAYMACALWSLMLFLFYREASRARQSKTIELPFRRFGAWLILRRVLLIVVVGFPLFLLTPRHANERWNLLNPASAAAQLETGYAPRIDLTRTGPVAVSEEVAFEVIAEDKDGKPKLDLNPEQRWRGTVLETYEQGKWLPRHRSRFPAPMQNAVNVSETERAKLPDLGPGDCYVRFEFDVWTLGGLVIASPVTLNAQRECSIRTTTATPAWKPIYHPRDSILSIPFVREIGRTVSYEQVLPGIPEDMIRPAVDIDNDFQRILIRQPVTGIQTWTQKILDRMVAKGRLNASDLEIAVKPALGTGSYLLTENRAKVADALSEYLSSSGEFQYRMELRRSDLAADPTEDFLRNVKQGFCSHYATGLALMLRSVGIPARVVTGFRGVELQTEEDGSQTGRYVVRKSHSHSWVEALLERLGPDGMTQYAWLLLDPTPSSEATGVNVFSLIQWWTLFRGTLRDIWTGLILEYNAERQGKTLYDVSRSLAAFADKNPVSAWLDERAGHDWPWVAAVPGLVIGVYWLRRRRRRRPVTTPAVANVECEFHSRWLRLVNETTGIPPNRSRTSHELADVVITKWRNNPTAEIVQRACRQIVTFYYRVRFGGQVLDAGERIDVEGQLSVLGATLRKDPAK